jgi:tRNA (uracil-5-)-methyltransferase TRM9
LQLESAGDLFDEIAPSFDATRRRPWPETVEFLGTLPRGTLVLDVGCGNGRNAVAAERAGHRVVGFDLSAGMLARAKAKTNDVEYALADVCASPFRSGSFGAVLAVAVVHHIEARDERVAAMRELGRVMAPGARCLVGVWAREQERLAGAADGSGDAWVDWRLPDGGVAKRFYHLYEEGEFREDLRRAGLAEERYFFRCDNHYAVVTKQ